MKTKLIHLGLGIASATLSAAVLGSQATSAKAQVPATTIISRPLSFEANAGPFPAPAGFVARGQGFLLSLTPAEAVLSFEHRLDAERNTRAG